MEFHFLPTVSPLIIILITISYYQSQNPVFAQEEQYLNCSKPFQCGNISEINYPFWGSSRSSTCGHPDFQLNCTTQNATITISGITYQVLKIDNASRVLTLARTDYIRDICPKYLQNTTINANFFSYSDIQNVTLYYGCTSTIPSKFESLTGMSSQITCYINNTDISGYFLTRDLSSFPAVVASALSNVFGTCNNNIIVQANKTVTESSLNTVHPNQADLIAVLEQGFGLKYDTNNTDDTCSNCKDSGGACGYDTSSSSFVCYCSDRAYTTRCNVTVCTPGQSTEGKSSNNLSLPIGISVASVAVVGLVLGRWLMQRRKRKSIAQTPTKELLSPSPFNEVVPSPTTNLSMSILPYHHSHSKSDLEKGSTYFGVQVFSFNELEEATDNFDPAKELGSGGFGTVYYGVLRDGRSVAVKRLFDNIRKRTEKFLNEVEILHRLRHPNLVTLHGCTSRRSRELILVYDYIPNGTVADHLRGGKSNSAVLTWPVRLSIAIETADALAYLHASDVIHRDVKTNNILLDNKFHVKVADFGLSRLFPNNVTHVSTSPQGTPGYVDPEYYHTYQLTDKSDVYSFGVVLIELLSSLEAVDTNRHRQHINLASMAISKIQNQSIDELIDPFLGFEKDHIVRKMATSVAELAFRCLQQERDMRPTMEEVLRALKKIQSENFAAKAKDLDVGQDDVALLKHVPPPFSPDSVVSDEWISSSTPSSC